MNGVPVYIRRDHLGADSYTLYEPQSGQRYEGLSRDQARNQVLKWLGGPEAGFEKLCCNNHNIEDFSTGEARFMREMGELKTPDEIERTREKEIFTIDSSKFLKFQDRVRLLIWRTL